VKNFIRSLPEYYHLITLANLKEGRSIPNSEDFTPAGIPEGIKRARD
jgi:hypothetical protein